MRHFLLLLLASMLLVACGGTVAEPTPAASPTSPAPAAATATSPAAPPPSPSPVPAGPITSEGSGDTSTPITTRLALSHAPLLEETATLTFTMRSVTPAATTNATITLPSGAKLVSGTLEWQGELAPDEPQTLTATIRFVEEGNWTLEAKALSPQETGDVWGDASYIYLYVSATDSHPGFEDGGEDGQGQSGEEAPPAGGVDAEP